MFWRDVNIKYLKGKFWEKGKVWEEDGEGVIDLTGEDEPPKEAGHLVLGGRLAQVGHPGFLLGDNNGHNFANQAITILCRLRPSRRLSIRRKSHPHPGDETTRRHHHHCNHDHEHCHIGVSLNSICNIALDPISSRTKWTAIEDDDHLVPDDICWESLMVSGVRGGMRCQRHSWPSLPLSELERSHLMKRILQHVMAAEPNNEANNQEEKIHPKWEGQSISTFYLKRPNFFKLWLNSYLYRLVS